MSSLNEKKNLVCNFLCILSLSGWYKLMQNLDLQEMHSFS